MRSLWDRINTDDAATFKAAKVELAAIAKEQGLTVEQAYAEMATYVAKKKSVSKSANGRKSGVSFADVVFAPVSKGTKPAMVAGDMVNVQTPGDDDDEYDATSGGSRGYQQPSSEGMGPLGSADDRGPNGPRQSDEDDKKGKAKRIPDDEDSKSKRDVDADDEDSKRDSKLKGGKAPRVVAYDKNGDKDDDKDDDNMDATERAAYDDDNESRSKDAGDRMRHNHLPSATKSVPGNRSRVLRGVSFVDKIFANDTKAFPLEDQPQARQPRKADTGTDPSGDRAYSDAVMQRIGGSFASKDGDTSDGGYIAAGAGETWNGIAGDENHGAKFMDPSEGDRGHSGGIDRGVKPARPNQGRDGAYSLEAEGLTPGAGVVRVGPNFVLPGKSGGLGMSQPFIAPSPRDSVLKHEDGPVRNEDRKGLFSSVINDTSAMKDYK